MTHKISVVVPIYNVELYLSKCIDSIIEQTYTNLEIILVNDGSPDTCGDICDYYATLDKRIKVIHKKNGGLSDARNAGIDAATGKYISFIDSDDFIHKSFFETLFKLILLHGADIAQCEFMRVFEESNEESITEQFKSCNKQEITITNIEALSHLYDENYVSTVIVCNKLYKKELFEEIRFPKGKIHEDEFTTFKLLYKSKKIVLSKVPLYLYLQRSSSIMGEKFSLKRFDAFEAYTEQITFYKENKLFDLELQATIRLESLIRNSLMDLQKSELKNKDELFNYLINYYRNYKFHDNFKHGINKIIMFSFHYSPSIIVKSLCWLLDIRKTFINSSKMN